MRKSKFSDSQIIGAVKRVEAGFRVPDICREMGISNVTFFKQRAKYGGMDFSIISRMKEVEEENRCHKKRCLLRRSSWPSRVGGSRKKVMRPSRRNEMATKAVKEIGICIQVSCQAFRIRESCYGYERKLDCCDI